MRSDETSSVASTQLAPDSPQSPASSDSPSYSSSEALQPSPTAPPGLSSPLLSPRTASLDTRPSSSSEARGKRHRSDADEYDVADIDCEASTEVEKDAGYSQSLNLPSIVLQGVESEDSTLCLKSDLDNNSPFLDGRFSPRPNVQVPPAVLRIPGSAVTFGASNPTTESHQTTARALFTSWEDLNVPALAADTSDNPTAALPLSPLVSVPSRALDEASETPLRQLQSILQSHSDDSLASNPDPFLLPSSPPRTRKSIPLRTKMGWYSGTTNNGNGGPNGQQRQQAFGGTPMASTPSAPGISYHSGGNNANNSLGSYHGPASGAAGGGGAGGGADGNNGLVYPALHLHPVNDTFAPKQISLSPPGPNNKVKIGRQTNAKTMPHPSNGYFDSKVLSRMHAEVWCQDGKMFIKDVKSSNGTFINGERLSPEAQESDVFELHNEDLVEFGIDIVGDDNKTIIHHKVACRVFLVITAEDAMGIRNDFANLYRGTSSQHAGPMGGSGIGPGAEGGLRRGKNTMSFDHILGKLQMELQRSRETGGEIGSLNSAIGEIQDSIGGGLPPMHEPPYPNAVPPMPEASGSTAVEAQRQNEAGPSSAVATLQAQLAETQSSISSQVDKIRALEAMLAEQEVIKAEVGSIKSQMEEAKRELDEMANSQRMLPANFSTGQGRGVNGHGINKSQEWEDEGDFDDGASMASVDTVTPEADVGQAPQGADEVESQELQDSHVGPRAPPDLPPELAARDAAAAAAVSERGASNAAKAASSLESSADDQLSAQNRLLTARLEALEGKLEEALSYGRSLQSQHAQAAENVKALEGKVKSLEGQMSSHADQVAQSVRGRIDDALQGRFSEWKTEIEAGWTQERKGWQEEREKLRQVIEAWDAANGKLEEQAAHQLAAAAGARSPSSAIDEDSSPFAAGSASASGSSASSSASGPSLGGGGGGGGRRRASKAAKRRAAKRHLNPALRALLYKDSHNEDLLLDHEGARGISSDDEDASSSGMTSQDAARRREALDTVKHRDSSGSSSTTTTTTAASGSRKEGNEGGREGGSSGSSSGDGLFSSSSEAADSRSAASSRLTSPEGSIDGSGGANQSQHLLGRLGLSSSKGSDAQYRQSQRGDSRHSGGGGGGSAGGAGGNGLGDHRGQAAVAFSALIAVLGWAVYGGLGKDAANAFTSGTK
ncbi:unnamed protein product [Jaminaea pallidilutea]